MATTSLTYPKLNEFIKLANTIDTTKVPDRDPTNFFTYLKRALTLNAKMFGHYRVRKAAISSFDFSIAAKEEAGQAKADETKIRLNNALLSVLGAQLKTVAYGSLLIQLEVVTDKSGNKLTVKKVLESSEYDYAGDTIYLYKENKEGRRERANGYETTENISLSNDYLFDVEEFPHAGGLLRSVMPVEILRLDMLVEEANYLRKLKGLLQVINKGGSDEDQKAAETAATQAIRENFFVSSDTIDMKLNTLTGAQGYLSFRDFKDTVDSAIAIAWLGQANTSELPRYAGSRAALQVQRMISADIFYQDMIRAENLMNKLLLIDFRLNYKAGEATMNDLPYKFQFNLSEEQDVEKNANALKVIRETMDVREDEAYKFVGFTPPQEGDKILPRVPATF